MTGTVIPVDGGLTRGLLTEENRTLSKRPLEVALVSPDRVDGALIVIALLVIWIAPSHGYELRSSTQHPVAPLVDVRANTPGPTRARSTSST